MTQRQKTANAENCRKTVVEVSDWTPVTLSNYIDYCLKYDDYIEKDTSDILCSKCVEKWLWKRDEFETTSITGDISWCPKSDTYRYQYSST